MQGETLFISDLHMDSDHPEIQRQFFDFLQQDAKGSDALYILGDLFEVWLGDDDDNSDHLKTIEALRTLSQSGTPIYIQHGNRDFLIGKDFEKNAGCTLLPDPYLLDLYGEHILIMHGDLLCTDDVEYQALRQQVRDPQWQKEILQLPLGARKQFAKDLRAQSQLKTQAKPENIMDVSQDTVEQYMKEYDVKILVHGHTHRPGKHQWNNNNAQFQRIVLGDWYSQGSVLRCHAQQYDLESLARN